MRTLTLILTLLFFTCTIVLVFDAIVRESRRRDREIVRRLHRYLSNVPPRSPW